MKIAHVRETFIFVSDHTCMPPPAATAILPGRTTLVHNAIPAVATQILQRQTQPATLVKEAARAQYKFGYR